MGMYINLILRTPTSQWLSFFHALSKNKNKIYFLSKQGGATWKSNQQAIIKYHAQSYA